MGAPVEEGGATPAQRAALLVRVGREILLEAQIPSGEVNGALEHMEAALELLTPPPPSNPEEVVA